MSTRSTSKSGPKVGPETNPVKIVDPIVPSAAAIVPKYKVGDMLIKGDGPIEISAVEINTARGPIYCVTYLDGPSSGPFRCGGSSFWWDEPLFSPITDPVLKLRAELTRRCRAKDAALAELDAANRDIERLTFALKVVSR